MSDAQVWLSQGDAASRLTAEGDTISRTALLRYLQKHTAIPTRTQGQGHPVFVDYEALKLYRQNDPNRAAVAKVATETPAAAAALPSDDASRRIRLAKAAREEDEARSARVRADREEGLVILKADAVLAFQAVAAELIKGFDTQRRSIVQKIRSAGDARQAEIVMRNDYERTLQVLIVRALGDMAELAELPEA